MYVEWLYGLYDSKSAAHTNICFTHNFYGCASFVRKENPSKLYNTTVRNDK